MTVVNTLSNVVAPAVAGLFSYQSCLNGLIVPHTSYPRTDLFDDCESGWKHGVFQDELDICEALGKFQIGGYTPEFRFRPDYCASTFVHVFAPFFILVHF
jgi:hypothetical protein